LAVLLIEVLYKVMLTRKLFPTFESVDEILKFFHQNGNYCMKKLRLNYILSYGTLALSKMLDSKEVKCLKTNKRRGNSPMTVSL